MKYHERISKYIEAKSALNSGTVSPINGTTRKEQSKKAEPNGVGRNGIQAIHLQEKEAL